MRLLRLVLFFSLILVLSSQAWAAQSCPENPYCQLMIAIGQCPRPNNPYEDGMKVLAGNDMQVDSWSSTGAGAEDFQITVTKDSGRTLRRNVGMLKLHTAFLGIGPSAELTCSLKLIPVQ